MLPVLGMVVNNLSGQVLDSFTIEVKALKPGNVSTYSAGHGMTAADFVKSAALTTPILCNTQMTVGERILQSVNVTMQEVGCNTNLGMLLLFAPLIRAAEMGIGALQENLQQVLVSLDAQETNNIFQAINKANPGGLGTNDKYDVRQQPPSISVREAMQQAEARDLIAKQYVTDYADVFSIGLPNIEYFFTKWHNLSLALVACYLEFMSNFPDTHVSRKMGKEVAEQIKVKAGQVNRVFQRTDKPENNLEILRQFDRALKQSRINPGTSADLAAASLLLFRFQQEIK